MSAEPGPASPLLRATYRLQLNAQCTLRDALALVPYLHELGISHLYASPVLRSRAGSGHGYDVVDPTQLDPELGTDDDWRALAAALRARGMGLLLDIVPNHMAVGSENPFWRDVLTHGPASRFAHWFDIDWNPPQRHLRGRVLVPVLGDELAALVARGEIVVVFEQGCFGMRYQHHRLPLDPATIAPLLAWARGSLPDDAERAALLPLEDELRALPSRAAALRAPKLRQGSVPTGAVARRDAADAALVRLSERAARSRTLQARLAQAAADFGAAPGGRERIMTLLDAQPYALARWQRADIEINYRRFFDINDLVALRQEDASVFAATHRRVLEWVADGSVVALRIDHVDGLRDPRAYLERLRQAVGPQLPLFVEKILSGEERLRDGWPVQGTTGYEFLNQLEGALVQAAGARRIEAHYRTLLPARVRPRDFADEAREGKARMLRSTLGADLRRLSCLIRPLAAGPDAPSGHELREAIVAAIATLPVYRTYVERQSGADGATRLLGNAEDYRLIDGALTMAQSAARPRSLAVVSAAITAASEGEPSASAFVERFQQTSGPAAAKGVEDTALYRYAPLASLCEVGGDPGRPLEHALDAFHRSNAERGARWPGSLLTVTTHDTKRSADVRARIDVLSEVSARWTTQLSHWLSAHDALRRRRGRRVYPDRNTMQLLYQSALGVWPWPDDDLPATALEERLTAYMLKASREAKGRTTWSIQNAEFEQALSAIIGELCTGSAAAAFAADLRRLLDQVARPGIWNGIARTIVQCTSPGTPDVYQGDELWSHALVDPDNRRPVDFAQRQRWLDDVAAPRSLAERAAYIGELLAAPGDGRLKLYTLYCALSARRTHPALFAGGEYVPLSAQGERSAHVIAFARVLGDAAAVTIAPRLTVRLGGGEHPPIGRAVWGNTRIALPPALVGRRWHCLLSGRHVGEEVSGGRWLSLSASVDTFPGAILMSSPALDTLRSSRTPRLA